VNLSYVVTMVTVQVYGGYVFYDTSICALYNLSYWLYF